MRAGKSCSAPGARREHEHLQPRARSRSPREVGRRAALRSCRSKPMILILAILLAVGWLLGFTVFHVASATIHILLVAAIIGVVLHLVRGVRTTGPTGRLG